MTIREFCETYAVERRNTNCVKWDMLKERFGEEDLLPLWIADMDFRCSDAIIQALHSRTAHGAFGYAFAGDDYYRAAINWQRDHFGVELKKEWFRFSPGIVTGIYRLLNAFSKFGESVLIFTPGYYPFRNAVNDTGRKLITCELVNTDGFYTIDYQAFEKQVIEEKVKIAIFCSPHNPVCRVWREEEIRQFLEICQKHNVLVISDEIHQDIVFGGNRQISSIAVDGSKYANNIITAISASKTFNLASLPNSHIIIVNEPLREQYDIYVNATDQTETNSLALVATQAGYEGGREWLKGLLNVVWKNYENARAMLQEQAPKIIITPMEGTYLMWLDMRGYMDEKEVGNFALKTCGIAIDYGEWFSENTQGFIRVNLATKPENVEEAMSRIIRGVRKLSSKLSVQAD